MFRYDSWILAKILSFCKPICGGLRLRKMGNLVGKFLFFVTSPLNM